MRTTQQLIACCILIPLIVGSIAAAAVTIDGRTFRSDGATRRAAYNLTWTIKRADGAAQSCAFAWALSDGDGMVLDIIGGAWKLQRLRGNSPGTVINGKLPVDADAFQTLTIRRRERFLSAYMNDQLLFRVLDGAEGQGGYGSWSIAEDVIADDVRLQAVSSESMVFRDDFMRLPDSEAEIWETISGTWKLQSTADSVRGEAIETQNTTRNANPFVYRGTGNPEAVALAGYGFWDDLSVSASVRSQGGRCGLVFGARAAHDYFVLVCESTAFWPAPARLAIERVRPDGRTVLAETYFEGQRLQWYRIGVEQHGPRIIATLQDSPVLNVVDHGCAGGRFGMYAADGAVDFDDIDVRPAPLRPLVERSDNRWIELEPEGAWRVEPESIAVTEGPAKARFAIPGPAPRRVALTVTADGGGDIFIACGGGGTGTATFRWSPDAGGKRTLTQRSGTDPKTVTTADGGYQRDTPTRLIIENDYDGVAVRDLNRGLLLRRPGLSIPTGGIDLGFTGKGKGQFSDLVIDGPDERDFERPVKNEAFATDHHMQEWSAPVGQWVRDTTQDPDAPPLWWHKGDCYGAVSVQLPAAACRETAGARIRLGELSASFTPAAGRLSVRLAFRDDKLARADVALPDDDDTVAFHRDGDHVWIRGRGEDWIAVQLPQKRISGSRLGLQLPNEAMLGQIELRRGNVLDYQFDRVPSDWHKLGRWEINNRYNCDPRWGYMVGTSDGLAAFWHRDSFEGDVTLEFYAGMRMRSQGQMINYIRPGDANAVIGTGRGNVFDGYTFVISGWDTTLTRILRNEQVVAESDTVIWQSFRLGEPNYWSLHRRWLYVKIRRRGSRLELYADNKLILKWTDDRPLDVRRLGLWTVNKSIVIARTKISYSRRHRYRPETEPVDAVATAAAPATADTDLPALSLSSTTHPGCHFAFDKPGDLRKWQQTEKDSDARIVYCADGLEGGALRAVNPSYGGRFRVPVPVTPLEIRHAAELSFAIRMQPSVKIDLHARISGQDYVLRLTGPVDERERITTLGRLRAAADGKWHTVSFPLGDALAAARHKNSTLTLDSLYFGVRGGHYILAGHHGNPVGATFDVDNFEIWSCGDCRLDVLAEVDGVFTISREDGGKICSDEPFEGRVKYDLPEPGRYRLTVSDKTRGEMGRFRFAAHDKLKVTRIEPDENAAWGGTPLRVHFNRTIDIPLWHLQFSIGDRKWSPGTRELQWDSDSGILTFDPVTALRDTAYAAADIINAQLHLNAPQREQLCQWRLTYDPRLDKVPPSRVRIAEASVRDTFEHDFDHWVTHSNGGARLVRDRAHAATGNYGLKLINQELGGTAGARREIKPFVAGQFPIVSFDMRMTEPVRLDLLLNAGGVDYRVGLTDSEFTNTATVLTRLGPIEPDGEWRHYTVDFAKLMFEHEYHRKPFIINKVSFEDYAWKSNVRGAPVWIDNFFLLPSLSSAGKGFALNWSASDLSGIAGYSGHWSTNPDDDAHTAISSRIGTDRFTDVPEGRSYFHIRAIDNAGNWGPTASFPFRIDNSPPSIERVFPAPDSRTGETRFGFRVADNLSGFDPETIALTVDNRTYRPGHPGVNLDMANGMCTVDWFAAGHRKYERPPIRKMAVKLSAISDQVGNRGESRHWSFTYERRLDRKPPPAPVVKWLHGRMARQHFFGPGQKDMNGTQIYDEALGNFVSRTRIRAEGKTAEIRILEGTADAAQFPYLTFRYRLPPETKLDFITGLRDPNRRADFMVIKMTDSLVFVKYRTIAGTLENMVLDDRWHTAVVDLRPYIEKCMNPGAAVSDWTFRNPKFQDVGQNWPAKGTAYYFDDVQLQGPGPRKARFRFSTDDASGIHGYSWTADRDPNTSPPPAVNAVPNETVPVAFKDTGLWYVHARAVDGNGNWSQPGHFAYIVEAYE